MKRFLFLAAALGLLLSSSAVAATYGTITADVYASAKISDGYYLDYDVKVTGVNTQSLPQSTSFQTGWYEAFCIDFSQSQDGNPDLNVTYTVADLETAPVPAMGVPKANLIRKLVANAYFHNAGIYTPLTVASTIAVADPPTTLGSNESTVASLQLAIWAVLGHDFIGASPIDDIKTDAKYMLDHIDESGKSADLYALTSTSVQDMAIMATGQFQEAPEPGTLAALCGLGLMLGGAAYRRRRNAS